MAEKEVDLRPRLSRRGALKVLAGSASVAAFPILNNARPRWAEQAGAASVLAPTKFFTPDQARTVDALAETIIPADEHSPGAHAARVYAYIDAVVADSGATQKSFWTEGLSAIDKLALAECGKSYSDCAPDQQFALLEKLSRNEDHPQTRDERFFVAVKRATIDGYYTSETGIHQDLQYQGNTAMADFEGCKHEEHGKP